MVQMKTNVSLRKQRQNDRIARYTHHAKGVRVVPANDDLRRVLKHPSGVGFPSSGSAEWPNDRFTKRRIADGSVTLEGDDKPDKNHHHQRRQSRPETESAA